MATRGASLVSLSLCLCSSSSLQIFSAPLPAVCLSWLFRQCELTFHPSLCFAFHSFSHSSAIFAVRLSVLPICHCLVFIDDIPRCCLALFCFMLSLSAGAFYEVTEILCVRGDATRQREGYKDIVNDFLMLKWA